MTQISVRVRNRLQDGLIDWQEKRYRKTDFRQQQADIHRSRMTCSASLPSFHQTQDWTGRMGVSPSGQFRVIEETKPKRRAVSGEGIRWDLAVAALIVAGLLFLAFIAADLAGIGTGTRTIGKLNSKINALEAKNDEILAEIELGSDSSTVCSEAVKLDLISSNGARLVRITAPADATLTLSSEANAEENAELEGRMISYSGD